MHILELPLEELQRIGKELDYEGSGSFEAWIEILKESKRKFDEFDRELEEIRRNNPMTEERAEQLIADLIANPEDQLGFAQRMAFDPDSVTIESMIANIRSQIVKK